MADSDTEQGGVLNELSEDMTIEELTSWLKRNDIPDSFCQIFAGTLDIN